jgi:hypothetical protein
MALWALDICEFSAWKLSNARADTKIAKTGLYLTNAGRRPA